MTFEIACARLPWNEVSSLPLFVFLVVAAVVIWCFLCSYFEWFWPAVIGSPVIASLAAAAGLVPLWSVPVIGLVIPFVVLRGTGPIV